ncbi:MAG: heavy metal sensor histidine kinase [Zoogloeaceae bacterium]|nr:heavy metal sensor histidine kinase [Zoogloeaceae bacterium]
MSARRPLSLTARFALIFAAFAAGVLLVAGMIIERAVATHFDELDEHDLAAQLTVISNLLLHTASESQFDTIGGRVDDLFGGHAMVAVKVSDSDGQLLHAVRGEVFPGEGGSVGGPPRKWSYEGREFIGRATMLDLPLDAPGAVRIEAALDISHHSHFLEAVRLRLWLGITLVALAAAALAWFAARRGLAPLRRVTATARRLSAERLGERLLLDDAPTEVQELVEAFNGMLDRLEAAFRRLDAYSADIAHELRTPVSNLMTATEVALSRARSADEYRDTLHSNLEEFERMARMIADMLFLAKADEGRLPRAAEAVRLEAEAAALAEFYEALAEETGVAIRVSGAGSVTGDRLMLRRALSNLLSNALRHARRGSCVDIAIEADAAEVRLSVTNVGETIVPERAVGLFERFHRIEGERARHGEGAGLGLAITRSIVQTHGGRIAVRSQEGLTCFTLYLPRARTEPTEEVSAP